MNPLTKEMLDYQIEQSRHTVADIRKHVDAAREQLGRDEARLAAQEEHLQALESLRALSTGRFTTLPPAAVQSDEDVMGLAVGPLRLAPSDTAGIEDLRLYLATMRAIQTQAIHQARLVADEVRRREGQATQTTAAMDALAAPNGAGADARASCELCETALVRVDGTWLHIHNQHEECIPGDDTPRWAKPTGITAWPGEQPAAYPEEPATGPMPRDGDEPTDLDRAAALEPHRGHRVELQDADRAVLARGVLHLIEQRIAHLTHLEAGEPVVALAAIAAVVRLQPRQDTGVFAALPTTAIDAPQDGDETR